MEGMKIVAIIWYTINGLGGMDPYYVDAPFYVKSKAECLEFAEKVVEDYERTQAGWKHDYTLCKLVSQ